MLGGPKLGDDRERELINKMEECTLDESVSQERAALIKFTEGESFKNKGMVISVQLQTSNTLP